MKEMKYLNRPSRYKTKQSEAILAYIASLGEPVTAGEIVAHFKSAATPIALTTVYRHLEKFEERGEVLRSVLDESGARYQYVGGQSAKERFYLKCEQCGGLEHLSCGEVHTFRQHIIDEHDFQISPTKAVLYGKCKACVREG